MPDRGEPSEATRTQMGGSEAGRTVQPCQTPRRARVRIVIRDADFEAQAGFCYRLEVEGEALRGKLDERGLLDVLVPESAATGRLLVWEPREGAQAREWTLELGTLQPTEVEQGARDRLENLGFLEENTAGLEDGALAAYQSAMRLPATAGFDTQTQAHLDATYHEGVNQPAALPWRPGLYLDVAPDEEP